MASRPASSPMTSMYSRCFSGETSPFCNMPTSPLMDMMGVLNSCEKLLIKSERKISVLSSSAARWLKLSDRFFIASYPPSFIRIE